MCNFCCTFAAEMCAYACAMRTSKQCIIKKNNFMNYSEYRNPI